MSAENKFRNGGLSVPGKLTTGAIVNITYEAGHLHGDGPLNDDYMGPVFDLTGKEMPLYIPERIKDTQDADTRFWASVRVISDARGSSIGL